MSKRLCKCYGEYCVTNNMKYPKETLTNFNSKNYCPKCLEIVKAETKERDSLYECVAKIYGNDYLKIANLIKTQIKRYRENENMKYKGMEITLYFMVHIENVKFDNRGIALLPFYYERAKEWYIKNQELKKHAESFVVKEKVVFVSQRQIENKYRENRMLSMEDL